jgi:Eukaryotic DNA topoisomerase I, catalytic core
LKLPILDATSLRIAARYQQKKKLESGNTVYIYSPRQVSRRNNEKADRIEGLRSSLGKLRSKVEKDLHSKDTKTKLTALVVALIDHTYERVGNSTSAEERGHFGVTGWQKQHISIGKGKATIKYTGKSGVKHEKVVDDAKILPALKAAYDSVEKSSGDLFEGVSSEDVNEYLSSFDITAKDLRGLHANREVQERLRRIRSKGPTLPHDQGKRDKILKSEFKEALEGAAEAVGHEASTLRSQYLVPGLEDEFLKSGEIIEKFNVKTAGLDPETNPPLVFSNRIIRQLVDHLLGEDFITEDLDFRSIRLVFREREGSWEKFMNGDTQQNKLLQDIVSAWAQLPGRKKKQETI